MTLTLSIALARHLALRSGQPQEQASQDADENVQGKRVAEAKQARDTRANKAFAAMKWAMQEERWQDAYDLNVRVAAENPDFPGRSEAEREINNQRPGKVDREIANATTVVDQQVAAVTTAAGPTVGAHLCDNQDGHYRGVVASIHQVESPVMGSYTAYKLTNGEVVADAIVRVCNGEQ